MNSTQIFMAAILLCSCSGSSNTAKDSESEQGTASDTTTETESASESTTATGIMDSGSESSSEECSISISDPEDGWVTIPAGTFIFGSEETTPCRGDLVEKQIEITITRPFKMSSTEVTQAQWQQTCIPNPARHVSPDKPTEFINWFEALTYCNRLSEAAGLETCYDLSSCTGVLGGGCPPDVPEYCIYNPDGPDGCGGASGCISDSYVCSGEMHKFRPYADCPGYRLPTTAEWEYAARAGTDGHTYNGNIQTPPDCSVCVEEPVLEPVAWYCANSGGEIHPVAQKVPTPWGLYDILGNAFEWVDYLYNGLGLEAAEGQSAPLIDPSGGISSTSGRDMRGGYYGGGAHYTRTSLQFGMTPDDRALGYSFRPVRTIMEEKK